MSRPGDWNCRSCNHLNFQRRDSCQRCGDPRLAGGTDYGGFRGSSSSSSFGGGFSSGPDVRPGDWYCPIPNCGSHNFASRSTCFKCGLFKDDPSSPPSAFPFGTATSTAAGARSAWKSGDWICTRSGCNEHNFKNRTECFRCNAPRESSTGGPPPY